MKNWVWKRGYEKFGYEKAGYEKTRVWKNLGMKIWVWKCGYEKSGYEKAGVWKIWVWKIWVWKCGYEKAGYEKAGYEKIWVWKTGYESEGMKIPGMKWSVAVKTGNVQNFLIVLEILRKQKFLKLVEPVIFLAAKIQICL